MAGKSRVSVLQPAGQHLRDEFLGHARLQQVDTRGKRRVPNLGPIAIGRHGRIDSRAALVKRAADFRAGVVEVDRDDRGVQFLDPAIKPVVASPAGHQANRVPRGRGHALERGAPSQHGHLPLHAGRANRRHKPRGLDFVAIEHQVDLALGQRQALVEREHLRAREAVGEPSAGVELFELGQRVVVNGSMAVRVRLKHGLGQQNVAAIVRQTDVDAGPFEPVLDCPLHG